MALVGLLAVGSLTSPPVATANASDVAESALDMALPQPAPIPLETETSFADQVRFAYWRGRTCTTPACSAARPSGLADVAGFGFAAVGGVLISRRRAR